MSTRIGLTSARKNLARIIKRVAYEKETFVLTRYGEPLAAIVPVEDLERLQALEDRQDIEDAWAARTEPGERISWDDLKADLAL